MSVGKYTRGFVFGHGEPDESYPRAVVERSCAAVLTLLQDVCAAAEKTAFELASSQVSVRNQNRGFRRLADIVRYRPILEKSLVTAVTCAYADMFSADASGVDNTIQIENRIAELEKMSCECLDIVSLFHVDEIRDNVTNRNRPLLLDLNAQLAFLFGIESKKFSCNPLAPATLIGGFVAGLMCANMDVRAKQILFQAFEQEFLSRLSVLINSVILRLEQENTFEKRVVGFNDKNAGPIARVLADPSVISLPALHEAINNMHTSLLSHQRIAVSENLYELSGEDSIDSTMQLVSDVRYYYYNGEPALRRTAINVAETATLIEARKAIEDQLNGEFTGRKIPIAVKNFLETLWADILFDIYVASGQTSKIWTEAINVQQILVETITPVADTEKLTAAIPDLIRKLRKLLDESGCRFEESSAFLAELRSLHLQNMQQKLTIDSFVPWSRISLSVFSPSTMHILDDEEIYCYEQMRTVILELSCH